MRQLCLDALVEEGDVDFDWRLSFPGEHLYTIDTYLIFVIFFTLAKFLENKIYTEKMRILRQNTQ